MGAEMKRDERMRFADGLNRHFGFPIGLDIYSPRGTLVEFAFPNNGHEYQQRDARLLLTEHSVYTIDHIDVWDSSSDVYLQEHQGHAFNSVFFRNVDTEEWEP